MVAAEELAHEGVTERKHIVARRRAAANKFHQLKVDYAPEPASV